MRTHSTSYGTGQAAAFSFSFSFSCHAMLWVLQHAPESTMRAGLFLFLTHITYPGRNGSVEAFKLLLQVFDMGRIFF